MIKVPKTFFRLFFFFLLLGGFIGQSFASILTKVGNSTSSNIEFRSPNKKSALPYFFLFDSEEEFGEKEDYCDEDEWPEGNSFPVLGHNFFEEFISLGIDLPFQYNHKVTENPKKFFLPFSRPLYQRFHQWKFDLCINY